MGALLPFVTVETARLVAWFALLAAVFVPIERIFALKKSQPLLRKGLGADIALYFVNGLTPKLALIVPVSLLASVAHRVVPAAFYAWTGDLPLWLRACAAFVAGEIGSYWGHRIAHRVPFLWRFHVVHHRAEELDWLVNTKAHPVDIVYTHFCGLVPMYLLGLAQPIAGPLDPIPALLAIVGTMWGFFIHANLGWRLGPAEAVIASPAFHHWHHTKGPMEAHDKNFASTLPWLDRLFGTHYLPKAEWPKHYGVAESGDELAEAAPVSPFPMAHPAPLPVGHVPAV